MIAAENHIKEKERLAALDSYAILDTPTEEAYDNLTEMAAAICDTPISLVSLLDNKRQWFKSHHGLDATETPKELAFCAHAIHEDDILMVKDARDDERFHDNPLVAGAPKVIFYAGIPLTNSEGLPLGTLCVIDHEPRELGQGQLNTLKALAQQVMKLLELRKSTIELEKSITLKEENAELERFAYIAAHDLKSPLNTINLTAEMLFDNHATQLNEEGKIMLGYILSASKKLSGLIDGLLDYSKNTFALESNGSKVNLKKLCEYIRGLFAYDDSLVLNLNSPLKHIHTHREALNQILVNLVSNAVKYNDKDQVVVDLEVKESADYYEFSIRDNGPGIALEDQGKVFQIFKVLAQTDKFGQTGNGIGLATVKRIIEKLGGDIDLESEKGKGCEFNFNIKKIARPPKTNTKL
jgi:signal transduction histidine kinase